MRSILVKYLFGRYWWRLPFQEQYNSTDRAPFWFFNGFLLIGIFYLITGVGLGVAIPWFLITLYFGFPVGGLGYFQKYPVKWNELDDEQKWFYGQGATSGQLTKKIEFTSSQMSEWMVINKVMKIKYNL